MTATAAQLSNMLDEHILLTNINDKIKSAIEIFKHVLSNEFNNYLMCHSRNCTRLYNTIIDKSREIKHKISEMVGNDVDELNSLCDEVYQFYTAKLGELQNN